MISWQEHTSIGKEQRLPQHTRVLYWSGFSRHHLINRSSEDVVYLEVGDRTAADAATYPDDDLQAILVSGNWQFTRKDGTPY